jgi:hypothetical protein
VEVLANVQTGDTYANALTLEDDSADTITFVIGNASVFARFRTPPKRGGARNAYGPEMLLTPQTNSIKNVNGAQFRSAVAGTPARIVAQLTGPDDPQLAGGTPFSGTLTAAGLVTQVTPQILSAAGNATVANLGTGSNTDIPGASITFTVNGDNATMLYTASYDVEVNPAGANTLVVCVPALDGVAALNAILETSEIHRAAVATTQARSIGKGAHTLKLQAVKAAGGTGTVNIYGANSLLSLLILDQ